MSAVVSWWPLGALLVGHNVTGFRADFKAKVTHNRFSCFVIVEIGKMVHGARTTLLLLATAALHQITVVLGK